MSRARALAGDTVVLAFGTLGGRLVGILLLPLYTYALTRDELGTVDLVLTGIDLVLPLLYLSVSEALLRFAMSRGDQANDVLRTSLTFCAAVSAVVVIGAAAASFWLPRADVAIVASVLVVQPLTLVLGAWSRATGGVGVYAMSGVVQAVTVGLANVLLLLVFDLGTRGFLLSVLAGYLAGTILLVVRLPLKIPLASASFDKALLRQMLLFSAPLVPNLILWWLTNISGRYVLAVTHGVDEVGLFGVASRFPAIVTMATTVFAQAWQLSANRVASEGDGERSAFTSRVFRYYTAAMLVSVSTVILVLRPLVNIVVAPAFHAAWVSVPPLLVGAMFSGFAAFYGVIYTAAHESTGVFRTTLVAGVASTVLNLTLVPAFGAIGAAVSIAACFAVLWMLRVADSQRLTTTSVAPCLLLPSFMLIGAQTALQYLDVVNGLRWLGLSLCWLCVVWIFRRELADLVQRGIAARKWAN